MKKLLNFLAETWTTILMLVVFVLAGVVIGISHTAIVEKLSFWEYGIIGVVAGAIIALVAVFFLLKDFLYYKRSSDALVYGKGEKNDEI